eukprot:CAMPEP_0197634908 /NCGR_PEP_ID=MMETSP1338-20131121/10870_1 /TAXON_ID=43686 ORGANISM="Pelagodinium beii, Strain RCC1491" /NCGR_SAMPLE_ID=MMETSP1338 /ASSEMBLY_ACC=CAM_ASM_000754 /LENGTH=184 /DNA_ID=CAMNT_0043206863 /DNA_START=61 /DNA_END=615 /DNA_ORIENTATION=+
MSRLVIGGSLLGLAVGAVLLQRRKPRIPRSITVPGIGDVKVSSETNGRNTHVTLDWETLLGKLPMRLPFCSAVITGSGTVYVSGAVAAEKNAEGKPGIIDGGPEAEAFKTMEVIEACLRACGAGPEHITMVHAYLVDYTMERFQAMNKGYLRFWGSRPLPARICTGTTHVGLGGSVEFDVVAQL